MELFKFTKGGVCEQGRFILSCSHTAMKLVERKCKLLSSAKNVIISSPYIVGFTGKRAIILDGYLSILKEIKDLDYVYDGAISPDKTKLLLVSTGNKFYIISLQNFQLLTRLTIKKPYNDNLDGKGCWSLSGDQLYFIVNNKNTLNSALRCYDSNNLLNYKDGLVEKYWLRSITPIFSLKKYLLTGLNRVNQKWYLIWYDGQTFEEYSVDNFDSIITRAEYDSLYNRVVIYGHSNTAITDPYGNIRKDISLKNGVVSNNFKHLIDCDTLEQILPVQNIDRNGFALPDSVNQICLSYNRQYAYVATNTKLICLNMQKRQKECEINVDYGVQNIVEMNSSTLAISTWNGVRFFNCIYE